MPDGNGIDAAAAVLHDRPGARILMLTMTDNDDSVIAALRAGAVGYVLKGAAQAAVVAAIHAIWSCPDDLRPAAPPDGSVGMSPELAALAVAAMFLTVAGLERIRGLQFAPLRLVRRYLATDAAWYLVATAANAMAALVLLPKLSRLAIPAVAADVRGLPWLARLGLAIVVYDFVAFAVHVGLHRSDVLWSVHKVHHSSLQLDWLATTRAHMFENLIRQVAAQAPLFALGMPGPTVAVALVVYAGFALYGHSNLRVGGRWLETVFVTPRLHRLHHIPVTSQKNFATILMVWDRLFGTFEPSGANINERIGVPGEIDRYPQRFSAAFRQPIREARARRSAAASPEPAGT